MRKHLPGSRELFIFATLAIILSAVVKFAPQQDAALSLLAAPLFVFAAVMGLWKSGRLRSLESDETIGE
jgi:thiamine transporter ThiT